MNSKKIEAKRLRRITPSDEVYGCISYYNMVCGGHGVSCFLPEPPRYKFDKEGYPRQERNPDEVLCFEHASRAGYCGSCGEFWGGIESFEFLHPGLCDHCQDELWANDEDGIDWEEDAWQFDDPYDAQPSTLNPQPSTSP